MAGMSDEADGSEAVSTSRVEAFSDGVMAIAITLLILEIKVPEVSSSTTLRHELGQLWPSYASFLISFTLIGIIWVNHHAMFHRVALVDRTLLFLNLLLLLVVSFIPFPTAVVAQFLREGQDARTAVVLYSLTSMAMGLAFVLLWRHLARHPYLLRPSSTVDFASESAHQSLVFGVGAYAVALAMAIVNPYASLVVHALVAAFFVLPERFRPGRQQSRKRAAPKPAG